MDRPKLQNAVELQHAKWEASRRKVDYARRLLAYDQPKMDTAHCQRINLSKDSLYKVWVKGDGDFRVEPPPSDPHWQSAPMIYALAKQLRPHIEYRYKDFYRRFDLLCEADEKLTQWMRIQRLVSAVAENRKHIPELDEVVIQLGDLLKQQPARDEMAFFADSGFLAHINLEELNWPELDAPPAEESLD